MDQLYSDDTLVAAYDALNAGRDDFEFYLKHLPRPPCAVLDIGCGTGRFACAMAGLGFGVTAVDPAPAMINVARRRAGAEAVTWVTGLASDIAECAQFDAVTMTGHAFQCLLDDDEIEALFQAIYARLAPDGLFWFETRNPAVRAWEAWHPVPVWPAIALPDGRKLQVIREVLSQQDGCVRFQEHYVFSDRARPVVSHSTLRFATLPQIERLAARQGLARRALFGDWSGAEFRQDSPEIILAFGKTG